MNSHLLLASSSPRRRKLLALLGHPFDVIAADIDETVGPAEEPVAYARRVAVEKAQAVGDRDHGAEGGAVVLAADTIVVLDGAILGKPATTAEAAALLKRLGGRRHIVFTAVAVTAGSGRAFVGHDASAVWLRSMSDSEVASYVATGSPMDKAGAYAVQDDIYSPVARIEGSYTNVVGLPLRLTRRLVAAARDPG